MTTLHRAVNGIALICLLASCGDSSPPPPEASAAEPSTAEPSTTEPRTDNISPCLVTSDDLAELTGTAQTVTPSDVPGVDLYCDTVADSRGVEMEWFLKKSPRGKTPSHQKQRSFMERTGMTVSEVDLGSNTLGWLGTGPADLPMAQILTVVDGLRLYVNVIDVETDDAKPDDLAADATNVARAFVAGATAGSDRD